MTIESIILKLVEQSPIVGILMWLVWRFEQKIDKKDQYIEQAHQEALTVITKNTEAVSEVKSMVKANTEVTKSLSDRITNVLDGRNN